MLETPKGGFKYESLKLIGIKCPPAKGWRIKAVGMEVSEADFSKAIAISEAPVVKKSKGARKREKKLASQGQQSFL